MINVAVEGASDEEAARAVIRAAGRSVARVIAKGGKTKLDPLVPNYNQAALHAPWVVFRDSDTECPVELVARLTADIGELSPSFLLRIAHPMTEAWLLADRDGFADYFKVRRHDLPVSPETLPHPKQAVLSLCAGSRSRDIRHDVVTKEGKTGPLYVQRINEFAKTRWSVESASAISDSLRRAVDRIRELPTPTGGTSA